MSSFFSTDRRSSSWGRGEDTTIWGMYFFSLLTKITSFRHIPSTEKCVETDYNIYYSDSKDRDRLESYFRSNSILLLAVLFPKPQYKMAPTWRYKALVLLSYFLGNVLCASALKQLDGKSNEMFSKSSRTIKSSVGSSCTSSSSCDSGLYCYDGWTSNTCTSCTDSSYPCNSYDSIDGWCCSGSSSPSSDDFSWATTALASLYPGVIFSINDGCGWTIADAGGMEPYEGNCADLVFLENESDRWCTISFSGWGDSGSVDVCLANSEADCCRVAPGPTAGIAIALILLLAGIIACICRCCKCCCFKSKSEAPQVVVVQAPAATASEK